MLLVSIIIFIIIIVKIRPNITVMVDWALYFLCGENGFSVSVYCNYYIVFCFVLFFFLSFFFPCNTRLVTCRKHGSPYRYRAMAVEVAGAALAAYGVSRFGLAVRR